MELLHDTEKKNILRPNIGSSGQRLRRSQLRRFARSDALMIASLAGPAAAVEPNRCATDTK
jgi:hypothetical protein